MLTGFLTGILSGLGVGGGTLLLIWLTAFAGLPQAQAQGINLLYFLPCAALALRAHIKNGLVDRAAALPAAVAGLAAAPAFALLATVLDGSLLRRAFGAFLLVVGCTELFKKE
jgi:uncharacterized membrane protein YfcA